MIRDKLGRFIKGQHYSPETEFKKENLLGEKHPSWKGGRYKLKNGYIWINSPNHPRAYRNGIYEHVFILENKLRRYLEKGEVCHHINGIKDDNRPENLTYFSKNSEHMKQHKLNRWSRKYDYCISCFTNDKKHEAFGMCKRCYKKLKYKNV